MGHWSEQLVDEVAARVEPGADPEALKALLKTVGTEVELLTGRTFGRATQQTVNIDASGMPFAEVGDAHVAGFQSNVETWPVPDPANPQIATILQVASPAALSGRAVPTGQAMWAAGQFVAWAVQTGRLSPEYMLAWLGNTFDPPQRVEYLRNAMEPTNRVYVPIAAASGGGWWFQITRRLRWVTRDSVDDQRLVQSLIDQDGLRALVGVEPVLIAARVTEHPVRWGIAARIWHDVARPADRPWRHLARPVHDHGIPIMTIDKDSNPDEIACQLVLLAYWHNYIDPHDDGLAEAVATAYPRAVERVHRGANTPDRRSAASLLLVGLLHPGFDPALGAGYARRYVMRKATIAVHEHRKVDAPGHREWEWFGITERHYYKLLKRFAPPKIGIRYEVDDGVRERIRTYLAVRIGGTERRKAAMDILRERGFSREAARKWLQRHPIERVMEARPRGAADGVRAPSKNQQAVEAR